VPSGGRSSQAIPVTYVPARNTILLALALGWAEVRGRRTDSGRAQRGGLFGLSGLPARNSRGVRAAASPTSPPRRRSQGRRIEIRGPLMHLQRPTSSSSRSSLVWTRDDGVLLSADASGPRVRRLRCLPHPQGGLRGRRRPG
jgi:hypothetical protein